MADGSVQVTGNNPGLNVGSDCYPRLQAMLEEQDALSDLPGLTVASDTCRYTVKYNKYTAQTTYLFLSRHTPVAVNSDLKISIYMI